MESEVQKKYGDRVRIRACGLLVDGDRMLMVNHRGLTKTDFWAPPGGGIEFGETARECLKREFLEETGLIVEVTDFLFVYEFMDHPLHAVELFFNVTAVGGSLIKGTDPEMASDHQLIEDVRFLSWKTLQEMPGSSLHGIFSKVGHPPAILQLNGYLTI